LQKAADITAKQAPPFGPEITESSPMTAGIQEDFSISGMCSLWSSEILLQKDSKLSPWKHHLLEIVFAH
jgi:hypothetical protein